MANANNTKQRLLDSALEFFAKKGYNATCVDEIAAAAGIKGPSMYKYFSGKEALFNEISDTGVSMYKEKMAMNDEAVKNIQSADDLREFSRKQLHFTMTNERVRKLRRMYTHEQFRSKTLSDIATERSFTDIRDFFTKVMEELIKKGLVEDLDPQWLSSIYTSTISLLIQVSDREPDRVPELIKEAERHTELFIEHFFIKK